MPVTKSKQPHEWTNFEMHTMLCLIAKGVHLEGRAKRTDLPGVAKQNAYRTFATELNKALNRDNYDDDISQREITRMLDQMLAERKQTVGVGGLVERNSGRVTRAMRLSWRSNRVQDFDGTKAEWRQGRREKILALKQGLFSVKDLESDDGKLSQNLEGNTHSQKHIIMQNANAPSQINSIKPWSIRTDLDTEEVISTEDPFVNVGSFESNLVTSETLAGRTYEWSSSAAQARWKQVGRRFGQLGGHASSSIKVQGFESYNPHQHHSTLSNPFSNDFCGSTRAYASREPCVPPLPDNQISYNEDATRTVAFDTSDTSLLHPSSRQQPFSVRVVEKIFPAGLATCSHLDMIIEPNQ